MTAYALPLCPQERHHTKVQYQLKSDHISLAQVFSKMEQVVEVLGIEDYSVSQTTLDNVSHLRRGSVHTYRRNITHSLAHNHTHGVL